MLDTSSLCHVMGKVRMLTRECVLLQCTLMPETLLAHRGPLPNTGEQHVSFLAQSAPGNASKKHWERFRLPTSKVRLIPHLIN